MGHTKITVVEMKFVDDTETAEATLAANDDLSLIMPINPMAITFFDWAAAMTEEEGSPINQYVAGIAASDVASAVTDCLEGE